MNCEKEYRQFMFDYDFHIFIVAWHGEAIPNSISRGVVFLFVRERILFDIALGSIQFFSSIIQKKTSKKQNVQKISILSVSSHQLKDERDDDVWSECFFHFFLRLFIRPFSSFFILHEDTDPTFIYKHKAGILLFYKPFECKRFVWLGVPFLVPYVYHALLFIIFNAHMSAI